MKLPIDDLNFFAGNPNAMDQQEFEELMTGIKHYSSTLPGWDVSNGFRLVAPAIINKATGNTIVGGNHRVKALLELGQKWIHEDDIRWIDEPDKTIEKALCVALNKIGGDFLEDRLKEILNELKAEDFNLEFTGFNIKELENVFKELTNDFSQKNREIGIETINEDLDCECPRCGFRFKK